MAEDILELCCKRPGLSLADVVMADGIEEERKPEHFRRKVTLRVEPPPKEYSNDEFLPLPDPEEVDEDAADELLRESLIEQGKDACVRQLVNGRTPADESRGIDC